MFPLSILNSPTVPTGYHSGDLDGDRFRLDSGEILSYERQLDLRQVSSAASWRS